MISSTRQQRSATNLARHQPWAPALHAMVCQSWRGCAASTASALPSGCRYHAALPPVTDGPSFSIRTHHPRKWSLADFMTPEQAAVIEQAVADKLTIMVAGARGRYILFPASFRRVLKSHLQQRPEQRYLFETRRGGPFTTRRIQQIVQRYREQAAITQPVHPHLCGQ